MNKIRSSLLLLLITSLSLSAYAGKADHIRNGDFEEGARFWFILIKGQYFKNDTFGDKLKTDSREGIQLSIAEYVKIENPKPAAYILNTRIKSLEGGTKYAFRYEVKSGTKGQILYGIGAPRNSGPNRGDLVGGKSMTPVNVTTEWQTVEIEFVYNEGKVLKLPQDVEQTVLQFRLGQLQDVQIRNIHLVSAEEMM